jgi:hypothetical protein
MIEAPSRYVTLSTPGHAINAPVYPVYQYPAYQYPASGTPGDTISAAVHPTYQPQSRLGTLAERTAFGDMKAAEAALNQGRPIAALTDTENAETVLLNGQQAGVPPHPATRTLAALSAADRDLQTPWGTPAAASALHTALADLTF